MSIFRRENLLSPHYLLLFFGIFVAIILAISLVAISIGGSGEITIVNQPETLPSALSEADLARVKKELFTTLNRLSDTNSNYIDVSVRWDSLEKTTSQTTFLIDVDAYRQTYLVKLDPYNVFLRCPDLNLSKYPDSFCVGNDGEYNDSISVLFGNNLPLSSETPDGDAFEIVRAEVSDGTWNRDLAIWILSCPTSDSQTTRVSASVDQLISERGGSPSVFTKKFYHMPCSGE